MHDEMHVLVDMIKWQEPVAAQNENKTRNKLHFLFVILVLFITLQVHGRCKKNNISGSKHYLTVASGVMMSVFVSPVIAAVTVGKDQMTVTFSISNRNVTQ